MPCFVNYMIFTPPKCKSTTLCLFICEISLGVTPNNPWFPPVGVSLGTPEPAFKTKVLVCIFASLNANVISQTGL